MRTTAWVVLFTYVWVFVLFSPAVADEIVDSATVGQQTGMELLQRMNQDMPSVSTADPSSQGNTNTGTVYIPEILPGADPQKIQTIESWGASMLDDPDAIEDNAMNHWLDIYEIGCRETHVRYVDTQVVFRAYRYLENRETGETVPYNEPFTVQLGGRYNRTLGSADKKVRKQRYDDTHDLVTVYETWPFPQPRDGTFFTYNHRIVSGGGVITSYGVLQNGFSTQGSVTGSVIEIAADLYRVERTYHRNPDGTPPAVCDPDPPDPCTLDGVDWCRPEAGGIGPVVMGNASSEFGAQGVYGHSQRLLVDRFQNEPLPDLRGDGDIARGLNTIDAMMRGVDPMVSSLFGGCTVADTTTTQSITVHEEEIQTCAGVFTEANGCEWTRRFNFVRGETKDTFVVKQYCRVQVPGTNPPQYTWEECPITQMPVMACPDTGEPLDTCTIGTPRTWTETIDENAYLQYVYSPFTVAPSTAFTWNDTESCALGAMECKHTATIYNITENDIDGCLVYKDMMWDGWCQGNIVCTDYRPCVTIDDVTFCEDDPKAQKIIEKIETYPFPDTHPNAGEPVFPAMCWAGYGEQMSCEYYIGTDECYTDVHGQVHCPTTDGTGMAHHDELCPGPQELCPYFVDDCEYQGLYSNSECRFLRFQCAEDARGLYSGICYVASIEYDCGKDYTYEVPGTNTHVELCDSPIRCLGTECHNVRGETNGDMAYAVGALTAVELMQNDFVCAETGEPPTEEQILNGECSIRVFEGENYKCKIPIGHEIGLTPNCCKEGLKAAAGVSAASYLSLAFYTINLAKNPLVLKAMAEVPGTAPLFDLFETGGDLYHSMTGFLESHIVDPFTSAVEHLGFKIGGQAAEEAAKEAAKSLSIDGIKQKIMWKAYDLIRETFGPELADNLFTVNGSQIALNATVATVLNVIMIVWTVYNILKIIGHIIFACTEDELQLGIKRKTGACAYVGSYCSKKALFMCVVKKESYCCYNTPLARIIMEQARQQLGGFGSAKNPNCEGLTISELQAVNWDAIDLSEWEWRLAEAGILPQTAEEAAERWGASNVQRLKREYGIDQPVGPDGDFTKADATRERMEAHIGTIMQGKETLAEKPYCYSEPGQTLQYPYPPAGPDNPACIYPP